MSVWGQQKYAGCSDSLKIEWESSIKTHSTTLSKFVGVVTALPLGVTYECNKAHEGVEKEKQSLINLTQKTTLTILNKELNKAQGLNTCD